MSSQIRYDLSTSNAVLMPCGRRHLLDLTATYQRDVGAAALSASAKAAIPAPTLVTP